MNKYVSISLTEAADRLAIRELVEAYAHCADRRDARPDVSLYRRPALRGVHECQGSSPSQELHSREALAPVFGELNKYEATTHFVGQSTIFTVTGDQASGEAYGLAHHVTVDGGKRRLMVASLRYLDTFVKMEGSWLFAERLLYVDWVDERAMS
jgi:SnoaL-like domain